jgi:putative membrane protein
MSIRSVFISAALALVVGAAHAQTLDDARIAAIVVTANQVDIDAGRLAARTSQHAEVTAFAERMVTDHTGVNDAAVALVTRLGITPRATDTSRALEAGGTKTRARLATLSGDAFDTLLIPQAANAELKALLVKVRPAFLAHLEHARSLSARLGSEETSR